MQYDMDAASEVYSYVDKSLMNEDATNQSSECLQTIFLPLGRRYTKYRCKYASHYGQEDGRGIHMQYVVDAASKVCSYVDKSLMNVDATRQFGGCSKEGGKQGNMSMYESELNSKDKKASIQKDM